MKNYINAEEFHWTRGAELEIYRFVNRYNNERYHGPQKGDISGDVRYCRDLIVSWGSEAQTKDTEDTIALLSITSHYLKFSHGKTENHHD